MSSNPDPLAVDRHFFYALLTADLTALAQLLADDFILIDVLSASRIGKSAFLAAIESGRLTFDSIAPAEHLVRTYGLVAVISGSARMIGRLDGARFEVHSRYTHVYAMRRGEWRLVAAQGTEISEPSDVLPPEPQPPVAAK